MQQGEYKTYKTISLCRRQKAPLEPKRPRGIIIRMGIGNERVGIMGYIVCISNADMQLARWPNICNQPAARGHKFLASTRPQLLITLFIWQTQSVDTPETLYCGPHKSNIDTLSNITCIIKREVQPTGSTNRKINKANSSNFKTIFNTPIYLDISRSLFCAIMTLYLRWFF